MCLAVDGLRFELVELLLVLDVVFLLEAPSCSVQVQFVFIDLFLAASAAAIDQDALDRLLVGVVLVSHDSELVQEEFHLLENKNDPVNYNFSPWFDLHDSNQAQLPVQKTERADLGQERQLVEVQPSEERREWLQVPANEQVCGVNYNG